MQNNSVKKTFFKYAIPSIVGLLVVSMQVMIDGIFVGNFVGPKGLAAINISMPYINTLMSVSMMIITGGGVISSIYLGRGNKKRSGEIASFTLGVLVAVLSLLAIISYLFLNKLILFLGANQTIFPMVKAYLGPMVLFTLLYNSPIYTENFARVGGKPNAVFLSGSICFISNVILDYFFIVSLRMGISGAAYATITANFLGCLAVYHYFFKKLQISLRKPVGTWGLLKNIFFNGCSEMLTVVAASFATFLFNRIVMNYIGEMGISALAIVFYVNGMVNISLYGLSQALQPIVAYNLGAGRRDKIYEALKISLITGGGIGIISFIGMKFYSIHVIELFTKGDMELTRLAGGAVRYFIFAYLISFVNVIASSFHTAIEKPMESAVLALLRSLVFVAVFLIVLPPIFGENGIWMAVPVAELSCLIVSFFMMKFSIKKIEGLSISVRVSSSH